MVRKETLTGALFLSLLFLHRAVPALERTIELGKDSRWKDIQSFDSVAMVPGMWGYADLALAMGEYVPDDETEFLFHFNSPGEGDAAGKYSFSKTPPVISESVFPLGSGSAVFQANRDGLLVSSPPGALFSAGSIWRDFTIEMWLYPSTLSQGQTVLSWEGARKDGSGLIVQNMRAFFQDRRLVWEFENFFMLPDGRPLSFALSGNRQLIPRTWHHHLLRFEASFGLLEYLIDGVPEAITLTTDTRREGGSIAVPHLGAGYPGQLTIAPNYTGFLDELRMRRGFVDTPSVQAYAGRTGTATSQIIDLGFSGTRISRIRSVYTTPADSAVEFYFKVSDAWTNPQSLGGAEWTQFDPAADFGDKVRGRYVQVMVELFPDGSRSRSPRVSSLSITYEPNLPPAPPVGVTASPGNGAVTVSWRKVNDLNVRGYRLFYGDAPHTFLGTGAAQGDSPIDVGDVTRLQLTNLENGKLYYFAIVAYDSSDPPQLSAFSPDVSARPSRIYP